MTLTQELRAFLRRVKLYQSDRELIERVIEEPRESEEDESRHDAHEKEEFEKAFPEMKRRKKRNM